MKTLRLVVTLVTLCALGERAEGQTSYTSTTATGLWNSNRWNNTSNGPTYTSAYTPNNPVSFTSGSYLFSGMRTTGSLDVGDITLLNNVSVSFTGESGTVGTGGNVRTINVGSGSTLDFSTQTFSTAAGTGFIKSGTGALALVGGAYSGGFTLNSGTVILRGVDAMGAGASHVLTLNGGVVASNASRSMTSAKYGGGIVIGGNVQFGSEIAPASATANLSFANAVSLGSTTRTLTIGNDGTTTFSGVISNTSGGLIVAANAGATGSIVLSGVNTYSGTTTISSGTLTLNNNGSTSNSSSIVVASGAVFNVAGVTGGYTLGGVTTQTLSGGGTIIGAATVGSNGTIDGGTSVLSPGISVSTSLTFGSGSSYLVKLFGTGEEDISLLSAEGGAILIDQTPDAGARLHLDLSALSAGDVATLRSQGVRNYTVIRAVNSGSTENFHESNFSISDLGNFDSSEWTLVTNPSSGVQLLFTPVPVPEPAMVLGIAVAALGVGGFARRRFRKSSEPASAA